MSRLVVFLDDGGVMNDNRQRGSQWQQLVGAFFTPVLGGTAAAWAEATASVAAALFDPEAWRTRLAAAADYPSFERAYWLDWLGAMCAAVGVPCPPEEQSLTLSREAEAWITARDHAAFLGAVETVRWLHAHGYTLHTSSGESSAQLMNYLTAMGVRDCFGRLYGPDLIDTFRAGPEYYERLLIDAGIVPADALVVDDSIDALRWARAVGARTVLVGPPAPLEGIASYRITSLADLPSIITHLEDGIEAVDRYLELQARHIAHIEKGLADLDAGRVHSHDEIKELVRDFERMAESSPLCIHLANGLTLFRTCNRSVVLKSPPRRPSGEVALQPGESDAGPQCVDHLRGVARIGPELIFRVVGVGETR